jgi:hypothetical protein
MIMIFYYRQRGKFKRDFKELRNNYGIQDKPITNLLPLVQGHVKYKSIPHPHEQFIRNGTKVHFYLVAAAQR